MIDNPFLDFQLTFGDWVALGDWFEDVDEIREMLRPDGKGADRIGQLYYALFARIRPTTPKEAADAQKLGGKEGGLWTEQDAKAVDMRYQVLKTRNIKHFSNPLVGDTALSTADKAKRTKGGKPFGAIAQYHHDHLEAIGIAITAAHTPDESLLGEALARDGFACHFLTDAFSGSHARTPRASIEAWWDKKVPGFDQRLVNWLADEATLTVINHPHTEIRKKGLGAGSLELAAGLAPGKARDAVRKLIRPEVPPLSFGDIVGLVVHDWEGAHGPKRHGPEVDVAGQRFHLAGDDDMLKAVAGMKNVNSDRELNAVLKDGKKSDAERTFAGSSLAVRASANDIQRAFDLAKSEKNRSRVIDKLIDGKGLFASERLLPSAVPDTKQPEEDRMPKWDYDTVDELRRRSQDPGGAADVRRARRRPVRRHAQEPRRVAGGEAAPAKGRRRAPRIRLRAQDHRLAQGDHRLLRGEPLQAAPLAAGARRARRQRPAPASRRALGEGHHPSVPGAPLNGPTRSSVIHPP